MATSLFFRCFNRGKFNCNNWVCCSGDKSPGPTDPELEMKIEESIAIAEARFQIDKLAQNDTPDLHNLLGSADDIVLLITVNAIGDILAIEGEGKRLQKDKRTIPDLGCYLQPKLAKLIGQLYAKTVEEGQQNSVLLKFENYDFILSAVPVPKNNCAMVLLVKKVHFLL